MSRVRITLQVSLLLFVLSAPTILAEPRVAGTLAVDGRAISLAHGQAFATGLGDDDPVIYLRLSEKAGGPDKMDGIGGEAGAMLGIYLSQSGKVTQVLALHPEVDPTWPRDLPTESVKVRGYELRGDEITATFENNGEVSLTGQKFEFQVEMRLPRPAAEP